MQRQIVILLAALLFISFCVAFRAESQSAKLNGKAVTKQESGTGEEKTLEPKADKLNRRKVGAKFVMTLIGNVRIRVPEDNLTVTADRAELDEETHVAKISGNVKLTRGEETTLTGDAFTVRFSEEQVVVTGNVQVIFKSKSKQPADEPQPKSDKSGGKPAMKTTTLKCERLDYDMDNKIATATGKLQIEYDTGSATAEKAVVVEAENLVTLEGKVQITEEGENKAHLGFDKVTINVDTGEINGDNAVATTKFRRKPVEKKSAGG